jgi:hypothetical protein
LPVRALLPGLCALGLLAGCAGAGDGVAPKAEAAVDGSGQRPKAMDHPDARFLVDYGSALFRVNVRYVPLIDESVIALREGAGEARDEGWQMLEVEPDAAFRPGTNFADPSYEEVAVDIARAVQGRGGICGEGQTMTVETGDAGEVRTLFRSNRRVWVVFALCPQQVN